MKKLLANIIAFNIVIAASFYLYSYVVDYIDHRAKNPGTINIQDMVDVEAICITKDALMVKYYGDYVEIIAIDCNGEPISWKLRHPKQKETI